MANLPLWIKQGSVPARSRLPAEFRVVIGTSHARSPDPSHRGHALLKAGVVAGQCAARFGVARTPRIIIGGLGKAGVGTDQRGHAAEYQRNDCQSHVDLPVLPPCKTPLRSSIVPPWNSPRQNKITGDLLILRFGGEGPLFYQNTTDYRMRRECFSACADQRLHLLRW
jgi:hypothetical protein